MLQNWNENPVGRLGSLRGNRVRTLDAVVGIDGSGHYRNVMDVIRAAPDYNMKRYVIYVKRGVYLDEYVKITSEKRNVMLIGDGIDATVISGSRSLADGYQTFYTATSKLFKLQDL